MTFSVSDLPIPLPRYLSRSEIRIFEDAEFGDGVTALQLMHNAGAQIAKQIRKHVTLDKRLLFIIGTGNNGGDALVAANQLYRDYQIKILRTGKPKTKEIQKVTSKLSDDIEIFELTSDISITDQLFEQSDILIDGIFGTGLQSQVREPVAALLNLFASVEKQIISVDLPSGMDCDTGEWYCEEYSPQIILSLQFSKKCFKQYKETEDGPIIEILDIGIRPETYRYISPRFVRQYWPKRDLNSHKGQNGRIMVIGGSDEFTGAPVLTGMATLRSGIDTLRIAVPESIRDIVAGYHEDFIVVKVAGSRISSKSFKKYRDMAVNRHDVIVIGMGLSNHPECTKFVREFFEFAHEDVEFVIDAEAIRAFKDHLKLLKGTDTIITPHRRELRMLLGQDLPDDLPELVKFIEDTARDLGIVILLKGRVDIISDGNRTMLNETGNPGMTVGGSGDVLAGVVAACKNFIEDPFIAAIVGSHVMGVAGDIAAETYGHSLLASDIIKELPKAFIKLGVNY